jgi:hypothetical protein
MRRSTSILVTIFYPAIVIVAVVLLAAVQIRASGGSSFDTWRLNYDANRALAAKLSARADSFRAAMEDNLDDQNFNGICLKFFDDEGKMKPIDADLANAFKAAKSQGKTFQKTTGDVRCLLRGFTGLQVERATYLLKGNQFALDSAANQKAIESNDARYSELIKGKEEFLAFKEMENSWYSFFIATIPYDLLVLLLVMFMGALGGMVRLLRDYGDSKRPNPDQNDYLFIPLIGLVVAIGGYVLAKTGLLLLSSSHEEASLSPFMVGLVGIISGLLARNVIDAIARQGAKMFAVSDAAPALRKRLLRPLIMQRRRWSRSVLDEIPISDSTMRSRCEYSPE